MRVSVAVAVACLSFVGLSAAADVQAAVRKSTNIPAQGLGPALQLLAKERGFQVVYVSDEVNSLRTQGASGELTAEEALAQLLEGTGMTYGVFGENSFGIVSTAAANTPSAALSTAQTEPSSAPAEAKLRLAQADSAQPGQQALQEPGEEALEEILVTGSYIRRSDFSDVGSPVTLLSRDDIAAQSPAGRISDVLKNLPQNRGNFATGPTVDNSDAEAQAGAATMDLRGLGPSATLVLLNGRRNARFPLSEDGRVDINTLAPVIMLERIEVLNDGASGVYGTDAVAGVVNFITRDRFEGFATSLDVRGTTRSWDTATYSAGLLLGSGLNRGMHFTTAFEYTNTTPLARGELPGLITTQQDAQSGAGFPGNFAVPNRNATGQLIAGSRTFPDPLCQQIANDPEATFNSPQLGTDTFFNPAGNAGRGQCRLALNNTEFVRDEERWISRSGFSWDVTDTLEFTGAFSTSSVTTSSTSHQSFPFIRTIVVPGENPGNTLRAVNSGGQPLFAVPDATDTTRPARDANGRVILTATPTDPASGIAFNEDVVASMRPVSTTNAPPLNTPSDTDTERFDATLSGKLGEDWTWDVGSTYSQVQLAFRNPEINEQRLVAALNGAGGPTNDRFFNPFGNSVYANPGDAGYNDPSVFDDFLVVVRDNLESEFWSVDTIVSGSLLDLPAGHLGLAAGLQYRDETLAQDFDALKSASLVSFAGFGERDFKVSAQTKAAFLEASMPVFENRLGHLEVSLAGRYEDQGADLDSFNPKASISLRNDHWSVRGSYGTSFLAPSLFQRAGNRVFREVVVDPVTSTTADIPVRLTGNPELSPQESTSFNVGLTITPVDAVNVAIDYWNFEFEDLLATPSAQGIVNVNPLDPRIERDANGRIITVNAPFFNAARIDAAGVDADASYVFELSSAGEFTFGLRGTYMLTYDVQERVGGPVIDGVGFDNQTNSGTTMPELTGQARIGWKRDRHGALIAARYISEIKRPAGTIIGIADSSTVVDAQYSYEFADGRLKATVGALNVFDHEPNKVAGFGSFYLFRVQDPIGRRVFANMTYGF